MVLDDITMNNISTIQYSTDSNPITVLLVTEISLTTTLMTSYKGFCPVLVSCITYNVNVLTIMNSQNLTDPTSVVGL